MAWTVPRTWVAGESETATIFNAHLRDQLRFLANPPRCVATASSTAAISDGVWTLVAFDAETVDTDTMHDNSTNNSRIIFTTAGTYTVTARTSWPVSAVGRRIMHARLNSGGSVSGGTAIVQAEAAQVEPSYASTTVEFTVPNLVVAANDYIEIFRYQSSGGSLAPETSISAIGNSCSVRLVAVP